MKFTLFQVFKDKRLYIGIGTLILVTILTILVMDKWIMPSYTNYNTGVTVPDITKLDVQTAQARLDSYGLRYEVIDKRSNEAYPPDYVLDQVPKGNSLVKPNRKVYLTINSSTIPMVTVPDVVNMSLRNAEIQLQNHGLEVGNITYTSSRFKNSVLQQSIESGTSVRRSSAVNLVVSDGLGMNRVAVPDILGIRLAEAQRQLRSVGLRIGTIHFQGTTEVEPNHILGFNPADTDSLFEGESIDLVVSELLRAREADEQGVIIIDSTDTGEAVPDSLRLRELEEIDPS